MPDSVSSFMSSLVRVTEPVCEAPLMKRLLIRLTALLGIILGPVFILLGGFAGVMGGDRFWTPVILALGIVLLLAAIISFAHFDHDEPLF